MAIRLNRIFFCEPVMKKRLICYVCFALALCLEGCGGKTPLPIAPPENSGQTQIDNGTVISTLTQETTAIEEPQAREPVMSLTEEQNGGQVALVVNDQFSVILDGNPTTGYIWEIQTMDSSVLVLQGKPEFTTNSRLRGGPGSFRFTFKALQSGITDLRLIYHRPFEKNKAPERVYEISVEIQK